MEKGNLSITSENMLPIIKKWLYSDSDIFIRELVSNACDAISKFKKLVQMGEATAAEDEKYRVDVAVDKDASTITVSDNGIGMTAVSYTHLDVYKRQGNNTCHCRHSTRKQEPHPQSRSKPCLHLCR